jgi:DNA mismatch endonuclease (patch repair protein)
MVDVHDRKTRSFNMSRIKGKNTKPELLVRRFLFSKGFRYKLHDAKLPGKPDLVLPKYKTVIVIHGCFWHGHEGCKYFVVPKTRTEWWLDKIKSNSKRDVKNQHELSKLQINVLTIFECELRPKLRENTLRKLLTQLTGDKFPTDDN